MLKWQRPSRNGITLTILPMSTIFPNLMLSNMHYFRIEALLILYKFTILDFAPLFCPFINLNKVFVCEHKTNAHDNDDHTSLTKYTI